MKNYFVYLPEDMTESAWGCTATSIGFTRVPAGSKYPPQRHPDAHHFTWERGRVLRAYQFILVSEGTGSFQSERRAGRQRVRGGDVLILFPGVWHRYAPDADTGWVEHWLECRGPAFDRAVAQGIIDPGTPVVRAGLDPDVVSCFERGHAWALRNALRNQAVLSTLGLHLLALIARAQTPAGSTDRSIKSVVKRAQMLILQRYHQPLNVERFARELKVGYSHFRKAFRAEIGVSPKQFHLHVRLQKAQHLLTNTDMPLKEIAQMLGFDSQFHFSNQFKASFGISPRAWREKSAHER